jgi:hypothetical protein
VTNSFPETPALTVGIDVSDRLTSFCVLDGQGEILEEGRVRTTPRGVSPDGSKRSSHAEWSWKWELIRAGQASSW